MRNIGTVIRFTLRTKMMTKSFIVTTVILALLMTIGVNLPYVISLFDKNEPTKLGMLNGGYPAIEEAFSKTLQEQNNPDLQLLPAVGSEDQLKKDVEEGNIDGYLKFVKPEAGTEESFPQIVYTGKDSLGMSDEMMLTNLLTVFKTQWVVKDSLTDIQKQQLNEPVSFVKVELGGKGGSDEAVDSAQKETNKGVSIIVVTVLIVLFFMTNMMTGNMIASEVTQEKSSRIMEILITSVSPLAQMFGKIIGMFLLGIIQIFVFFAVIIVNLLLPHNSSALKALNVDVSMIDPTVVGLGLLFYVLGYFLYATLFAAVGSIVSRTEDLGQAIMPITMLSLVAFYIPIFSVSTPDSLLVKIASYVPFFSPTTMLLRIGIGEIAWWEVGVSIAILFVSILVCGWLSAKIYRTGVLMYGKRPTWKEIGKAMKAYKI
ncbi:ABC transporter permease [Paenibacillus marinisediminis]